MAQAPILNIKDVTGIIDHWQDNEKDGIIFLTGPRGFGKSTFGYKTSLRLKCGFIPKEDIWYKREDIIQAFAFRKKRVCFADEAINVAYNRDFYLEDQKALIKAVNMYRDSCNVLICCYPDFFNLDKQMRNLCKMWVFVNAKGDSEKGIPSEAEIHRPLKGAYLTDPWDTANNQKVEYQMALKGKRDPTKLTTFVGKIYFHDLSPKQKEIYKYFKDTRRNIVGYEEKTKTDPKTEFYDRVMKKVLQSNMTPDELRGICFVSGRRVDTVRDYLNKMLSDSGYKGTVKDYVKPTKVIPPRKKSKIESEHEDKALAPTRIKLKTKPKIGILNQLTDKIQQQKKEK